MPRISSAISDKIAVVEEFSCSHLYCWKPLSSLETVELTGIDCSVLAEYRDHISMPASRRLPTLWAITIEPPAPVSPMGGGQGLRLIRNILYYAYKARAALADGQGEVAMKMTFPGEVITPA